ncbi:hypothetical protein U1Q18_050753 [Sarracenia purpurea var. burkii]
MALVCVADSGAKLKLVMEKDLRIIARWLWSHKLSLNIMKSKVVYYAYKVVYEWRLPMQVHVCENARSECGCMYLESARSYRYLGVVVNETLTWADQCIAIRGKLRSLNYLLLYLSKFLGKYHLRRFYRAITEPVLRVLQNKAVKIVAGLGTGESATLAFERVRVPRLDQLSTLDTCRLVVGLYDKFGKRVKREGLRGAKEDNLLVPNWSKEHSKAQFWHRGQVCIMSCLRQ